MKIKCKKCKKKFIPKNKENVLCQKCIELEKLLKINNQKVHFFKDAQEIIEENKMSQSYGRLSIQRDFSTSAGKPSVLKNVIKIPVVLAAEMVQWYRIDELPQWLRDQFPKGQTYVSIFKPYEELEMALDGLIKLPSCMDHPNGTYLKDLNPYDFEMNEYVKEDEVIGWIKDFWADPKSRSIKGSSYLTISKAPDLLLNKLMRGEIIDVSIGFGAVFGEGGTYKHPDGWDEEYELKQQDIKLGHLAILLEGEGKCTIDKCGLNHDHKILIENKKEPNLQKDRSVMGHIINFVDSNVQVKFKIRNNEQAVVLNKEKDLKLSNTPNITDIGNDLMPKTEIEILKEQLTIVRDNNKKLQENLSKIKTTELSTQLKDKNDELKITTSAFNKLKGENEELKIKFNDQKILLDKKNSEERSKLVKKISVLKIEGYSAEELKDETLCDLKKIEKLADRIYNSADVNLAVGGISKPNEEDYEEGHKKGKAKKMPSTSFDISQIHKKKLEKKE